jgi:hypothetical protein
MAMIAMITRSSIRVNPATLERPPNGTALLMFLIQRTNSHTVSRGPFDSQRKRVSHGGTITCRPLCNQGISLGNW